VQTSQVTSKKPVRSVPGSDGRLQSAVIKALDEMAETAKKIRDKPKEYTPGKPSGRMAPDYSVRCVDVSITASAVPEVGALFFEEDDSSKSFWMISRDGERVKILVGDLFPSGKYDLRQVRSDDFARALESRIFGYGGTLEEAKRDLMSKNSIVPSLDVSLEGVPSEPICVAVCDSVPLNDFEREITDILRGVA